MNIINELWRTGKAISLSLLFFLFPVIGYGQLIVDFSAGSTTVCSGSTVIFTDNSTGYSANAVFLWNFGTGASPSTANGIGPHSVVYSGSGKISVSLTVTDTISLVKTKADYITLTEIPPVPIVKVTDNCDSTSTLSTTSDGILLWSTGEMSSAIIVRTSGSFTVTTTVNGCTSVPGSGSASPKLSPSFPVQSVDCSLGFNKAVINISEPVGAGYEYRLDAGAYITETSFSRVTNGSHIITVRNASGCTTTGGFFEVSCDCVDAATVTLSSTGGSTCDRTPVTVKGNSFGGVAERVTITENGSGTVSPSIATSSPFEFTYTPKAADAGKTVLITVTTNNPLGTPCVAAKETYTLKVDGNPMAPLIARIIQPTCSLQTASVELDGLPVNGTWTLITTPGDITTTGNGSSTTITNIQPGAYRFTVVSEAGCTSEPSANTVIGNQPVTPVPPVIGAVSQPTCTISTGSVILNGLPATGNWTLTRNPGGVTTTGTGTSKLVTDLPAGSFTFTIVSSSGCSSGASSAVIINPQPSNPAAPLAGTIIPPTCILSTGSVELNGLPETGSWILTRYPGTVTFSGTGITATISGLLPGMYNFTLTNGNGCISVPSANIVIPAQPLIPAAPLIGLITVPTCTQASGSVLLSGLPASGTWSIGRSPVGEVIAGTGTTTTITGLPAGRYFFFVTTGAGCLSPMSNEAVIPLQPGIPSVIITDPDTICSTGTADLTSASVTSGSTPLLTFSYWTNISATIPYPTPAAARAGTYYIKGLTTSGCFHIQPVTVTEIQLPEASAGPDQDLEFSFETTMKAELHYGYEKGLWSVISGGADFADKTAAETAVTGIYQGTNIFLWTVNNGACPSSSDTVKITVHDLTLQTLMTPNMDGRNDYFVITGLSSLGRTELSVFDRRGAMVYENKNYDNLWNGVDYNDQPLAEDTYFYFIKSERGRSVKGFIVIRR